MATHVFLPVVTVRPREDGRFTVTVDWGSSYSESTPDDVEPFASGETHRATEAVDAWVDTLPTSFIIPPAPQNGV